MSQLLKLAVAGVGHRGKWHAGKYPAATDCELLAVAAANAGYARAISPEHVAETYSDYRDIIPLVDAISPLLPTSSHYKIARDILEAGIHCLIKKASTESIAQAVTRIQMVVYQQLVVQRST